MNRLTEEGLVLLAFEARKKAYAPYSHFQVGAALLAADGQVFQGCNIENAAYTPSNCAERTAFFNAVSEGVRDFTAIAIVGGKEGQGELSCCPPCGVCRQVMMEFCRPDSFRIILAKSKTEYKSYTLDELLPMGFGPENLQKSPE
ncbi:MAG: cytidine deaminase [Lachnospiraceae bacterium]|nr:cytidine deaminase [Lachnospiraceae bacterium]